MLAVTNFNFEPRRQRVYYRGAHAVQTARDLIAAAAEFTARVQNCENNADCRYSLLRMNTNGYAAPVIGNANYAVIQYFHQNLIAVARKRFIY